MRWYHSPRIHRKVAKEMSETYKVNLNDVVNKLGKEWFGIDCSSFAPPTCPRCGESEFRDDLELRDWACGSMFSKHSGFILNIPVCDKRPKVTASASITSET